MRSVTKWNAVTLLMVAATMGCSKEEKPKAATDSGGSAAEALTEGVSAAAPPAKNGLLRAGDPAPDFTALAHTGEKVELSKLRGKKVVLYFYPKDNTPGCTVEAKAFRDAHQTYVSRDVVVIGVSSQDNDSHREFAEEHGLPFLLIPDEERAVAKSYGVGATFGFSKRVTFLIDANGKIAKVYPDVTPDEHAAELLADIDALKL